MRRLLFSWMVVCAFAISGWAQEPAARIPGPTVTLSQDVLADGKPLSAGTYTLRLTDERPSINAGAPSDAQRYVEFLQNGKIVARVIAEVFPRATADAVGTSGTAGRAVVQTLRSGEFVRVSFTDANARYLIHLPTGPLNEPAPQPQSPSRIVLPPQPVPTQPVPTQP